MHVVVMHSVLGEDTDVYWCCVLGVVLGEYDDDAYEMDCSDDNDKDSEQERDGGNVGGVHVGP